MTKKILRNAICAILCLVLAFAGILAVYQTDDFAEEAVAFTGSYQNNLSLSEEENLRGLFSATNTFNCANATVSAFETGSFNTSGNRNGQQVMADPQITVLTHGLSSVAGVWSNQYTGGDKSVYENNAIPIAFDPDSLINQLSIKAEM